jgi:hypothetical protein
MGAAAETERGHIDLLALTFTLAMDHGTSVHVAVGVRPGAFAVWSFALAGADPRAKLCARFFFVSHRDDVI